MARNKSSVPEVRPFNNLSATYEILGVGHDHGSKLVRSGTIHVVWLSERAPRVTAEEIQRISREGLITPPAKRHVAATRDAPAPGAEIADNAAPPPLRRGRGRPRKHSQSAPNSPRPGAATH